MPYSVCEQFHRIQPLCVDVCNAIRQASGLLGELADLGT